jgi:hypothetical protein
VDQTRIDDVLEIQREDGLERRTRLGRALRVEYRPCVDLVVDEMEIVGCAELGYFLDCLFGLDVLSLVSDERNV